MQLASYDISWRAKVVYEYIYYVVREVLSWVAKLFHYNLGFMCQEYLVAERTILICLLGSTTWKKVIVSFNKVQFKKIFLLMKK